MRKLVQFWRSVTAGLTVEELWTQFRRETRASVAVFSAETGRDVPEQWGQHGQRKSVVKSVARAMFYRLTPARRLILLAAVVLAVAPRTEFNGDNWRAEFPNALFAAALFLFLLVLELADRVSLKRDLEIARDMQRMLLPEKPPAVAGIDIAFATRPANTVAGDYYDAFFRGDGQRLMLFVADVAGKGIPSGLLMARFQASVHLLCSEPGPLASMMERLNGAIHERSGSGRHFITCFAAELDPATREMEWVNAGQNPPLMGRADGTVERLEAGGFPLGMFAKAQYQSGRATLRPGDGLFIYTDGVTEANDAAGGEFGDARLERFVVWAQKESAAECLRRLIAEVDTFAGAAPQSDDITCLVLKVAKGAGAAF